MTILILIIGISVLILIHELGHFLAAKRFGLLVEEFGIGFPPRLLKKKIGETIYSVNLLPFGGFVRIHGEKQEEEHSGVARERSFAYLPVWRRSVIIAAGVAMNFVLGWLIISAIFMAGIPQAVVITDVVPGAPASAAGILPGDRILGFEEVDAVIAFVNGSKGKEIIVKIERGGETFAITVIPRVEVPEGEGALGISLAQAGQEQLPFFASIGRGFIVSFAILGGIIAAIGNLVAGLFSGAPVLENFVGPVGIFQVANQAAGFGLLYLLQLIALISLNLTVLNVLPVPALDGGRLLFLLIEKVKGSPISPKREAAVNAAGFVLLILLMVAITVRDVIRLF